MQSPSGGSVTSFGSPTSELSIIGTRSPDMISAIRFQTQLLSLSITLMRWVGVP